MNKKLIAIAVVLLIAAAGGVMIYLHITALDVATAEATEEVVSRTVSGTGHFAPSEKQQVVAPHSMTLQKVHIESGDQVEPGQLLAQGDTRELRAQRRSIRAERDILAQELSISQENLPQQLESARARLQVATENLQQARADEESLKRLFEDGAVSEKEYRQAQLAVKNYEAQVTEAQTALSEIQMQKRMLSTRQEQLEAFDARIAALSDTMSEHKITADEQRIVAEVFITEQDVAAAGTPLFLLHSEGMQVDIDLLAADARELEVGQMVRISGDAVGEREYAGTVSRIHPQAVEKVSQLGVRQRRVPVEIALEESPSDARPGYPADVDIFIQQETGLAVDRDAVFQHNGDDFVFVIEDGRALLAEVTVGLRGDDLAIINEGLQAGDRVVVDPPAELDDETRIRQN